MFTFLLYLLPMFLEPKIEPIEKQALQFFYEFKDPKEVTTYAYTASIEECDDDPTITASGCDIYIGVVAVSHDLHKTWGFGTKLYINGVGMRIVEDLMNRRHKKSIDIYIPEKEDAIEYGKKKTIVYVLEERY